MAASEARRIIAYGSGTTITATFASGSATAGNMLVAATMGGNPTYNQAITGYTNIGSISSANTGSGNIYTKVAVGGETSVTAAYAGGYSNALLLVEIAGVVTTTPGFASTAQTWTSTSHSMPSNSVSVPSPGGYALGLFCVSGGGAGGGGATATNGFTVDSDSFQNVGYYSEVACVHQIYSASGTASLVLTLPNQTMATGSQANAMVVLTALATAVQIPYQPNYQRAAILAQ